MKKKAALAPVQGPKESKIDLQSMERLLAFMAEHGLEEIDYEAAGLRIRLRKASRNSTPMVVPHPGPLEIVTAPPGATAPAPAAAVAGPLSEPASETSQGVDLHIIKSPIVGTFYAAPSPGAEPFVNVGDQVSAGQVLCIVEAMKLMNEIESDLAGEVARIYVENGQPVEYGESLFALRPLRKK